MTRTIRASFPVLAAVAVAVVGVRHPIHGQSGALVQLVSATPGGSAAGFSGTDASGSPGNGQFVIRNRFAANGRLVVFESSGSGLACVDLNPARDIFLRDRESGVNSVVSLTTDGLAANGSSFEPVITPDGRYVAFTSQAGNLVSGDTNAFFDVFVRDLQAGTTHRVSVSSSGEQGNLHSHLAAISDDGRFVAFASQASNLVPDDTNNWEDVFVHDRQTGATERVSVSSGGQQGTNGSYNPAISGDGRYVLFESSATNLIANDVNFASDIFLRDRQMGTTTLISQTPSGGVPNLGSRHPAMSPDARFIVYASNATDIVTPDISNGFFYSVYLYDRATSITTRASVAADGSQNTADAWMPSVSADGRYVAFESWAGNLVPNDTNGNWEVFRRDTAAGTIEIVGPASQASVISADGTLVYFQSGSRLLPSDLNSLPDVYLYGPAVNAVTPGLSFSTGSYTAAEAAGTATIVVSRAGNNCTAASVDYATSDGTATAGSDYEPAAGTLTFAAGETSKSFAVTINDDLADEADETVGLTLGNPTGGTLGTPAAATLTIVDDDVETNSPPDAVDDTAGTAEDLAVTIPVLANDTDAEGDPLAVSAFTQGAHGTVVHNPDGTLTYTPAADFNGTDTFEYTADDGSGATDLATVTVTIAPANDAPVAAGDQYSTQQDVALNIGAAMGVLANDTDVDGGSLVAVLANPPARGTLSLDPDGSFMYTPEAGFAGTDTFTYRALDPAQASSGPATVTITVNETTLARTSSCRPVIPAQVHRVTDNPLCDVLGEPFLVNRRLALIEDDTVPCVEVDTMQVTRCAFHTGRTDSGADLGARVTGHWMQARDGHRYAVVGQPITLDGSLTSGSYVVGTVPDADGSVACVGASGQDVAGSPAPGATDLIGTGTLEELGSETNAYGGGPAELQNHATVNVPTSSFPHPDNANLVARDETNGVAWYIGRGAALNDPAGMERDEDGFYYGASWSLHLVQLNGVQVPAAKRPSTASYPAPGKVVLNSRIRWLPANPYVQIANGEVRDPRVIPPPVASFTYSIGLTTLWVDASASGEHIVQYQWDLSWTPASPDLVTSVPTAEFPLFVEGPLTQGVIGLTVVGEDGQFTTVSQRVNFKRRFPPVPGNPVP